MYGTAVASLSYLVVILVLQSFENYFSNSLIIHLVKTKEIRAVTEFGNLILISIDFGDFIFPFSP